MCVLGRSLDCQIHIRDLTVSRRHARISRVGDRYLLEDLGSGNGTFVNEVAVSQRFLKPGDVVRVCGSQFEFQAVESDETPVRMLDIDESSPRIVRTADARHPFSEDASALTTVTTPGELQRMARRLKVIYDVAEAISSTLETDALMASIVKKLLGLFPRADRALVLVPGDAPEDWTPHAVQQRRDDGAMNISRTILHEVAENRQAVLSHNAMADRRFQDGQSVANFGIRAVLAAPIVWRSALLGVLYLDSASMAAFEEDDLHLILGVSYQSAVALGNARLHGQLLRQQRLEQDLRLAEQIQQSFLPRSTPEISGYRFHARYDPAFEIGGDFYDFIELPASRIGVVIADVSGKGVSAALYMARLSRDIRYLALSEADPSSVLTKMNRAVCDDGRDDVFVTMLYLSLDPATSEFTFASAGHMPPFLMRAQDAALEELGASAGLPLGVATDASYESEGGRLDAGDYILLYTDGLVEAMNVDEEMFGMSGVAKVLRKVEGGAKPSFDEVLKASRSHAKGTAQFDDTTVVCIERT